MPCSRIDCARSVSSASPTTGIARLTRSVTCRPPACSHFSGSAGGRSHRSVLPVPGPAAFFEGSSLIIHQNRFTTESTSTQSGRTRRDPPASDHHLRRKLKIGLTARTPDHTKLPASHKTALRHAHCGNDSFIDRLTHMSAHRPVPPDWPDCCDHHTWSVMTPDFQSGLIDPLTC